MDNLDQHVLAALLRWRAQGHRVALVTVAQTWGSAPRQPGAWLAVRDDGRVQGSVSGGCIEDDLIARMHDGSLLGKPGTRPHRLDYGGQQDDDAQRWGLPCGGQLALVIEPDPDVDMLQRLQALTQAGQLVRRTIDLHSGAVSLHDSTRGEATVWADGVLSTQHGPRWRLLIIGAGQTSRFLAPMAQALGYAVSVCDPRPEYHQEWDVPDAPWLPGMPDDVVQQLALDPHSAVVALTHDPKLDDLALLEALSSPAFYVGALGSATNNAARRERLRQHFNLSEAELARLRGPVGLPIGSRTPPEIAVAIAAELVAVRHGKAAPGQIGAWPQPQADAQASSCQTA